MLSRFGSSALRMGAMHSAAGHHNLVREHPAATAVLAATGPNLASHATSAFQSITQPMQFGH